MIGARLGPFDVLEKLGEGGMGEVYRARDTRLDRDVALKLVLDAFVAEPDRAMRFEREAKTLASLNHPAIAALYGLEQADGRHFLVMELVEGETLAERIARYPAGIPLDQALESARQIAEAVEAAHDKDPRPETPGAASAGQPAAKPTEIRIVLNWIEELKAKML